MSLMSKQFSCCDAEPLKTESSVYRGKEKTIKGTWVQVSNTENTRKINKFICMPLMIRTNLYL